MSYVYLIGDHDEHGTEHVVATLNRDSLPTLLGDWLANDQERDWKPHKEEAATTLVGLLAKSDAELAGDYPHELIDHWGGPVLHVVALV